MNLIYLPIYRATGAWGLPGSERLLPCIRTRCRSTVAKGPSLSAEPLGRASLKHRVEAQGDTALVIPAMDGKYYIRYGYACPF